MSDLVLHVIDGLGPSGGSERQLVANLAHFSDPRLQHAIVQLYRREGNPEEFEQQIDRYERHWLGLESGRRYRRLEAGHRLVSLVERLQPSLLHASLSNASWASRLAKRKTGLPLVETLTNISHDLIRIVDNPDVKRWKLFVHRWLDRFSMRRVDRFHAVSDAVARSWVRNAHIPREKIHVIPRGVDVEALQREAGGGPSRTALCTEIGASTESLLLLMVGRHEPQKGQIYAIRALSWVLSEIPQVHLLIAGRHGKSTTSLQEEIKERGLTEHVHLLGVRTDVPALMRAVDLFVFPSLFEGLPNALLEAMATGTTCISSAVSPMTELLNHGRAGRLVSCRDPKALAASILELWDDPGKRVALGQAAAGRVRHHYTIQQTTQQLEALYLSLLSNEH